LLVKRIPAKIKSTTITERRTSMRKVLQISTLVLILGISQIWANGLSLNSIGPRALGMGGAMIGLANDYTALYWNPAGLRNLQGPQVGVFFTGIMPSGTYEFETYGIDAKTKSNMYPTGGLMGVWNCMLTDKMTMSFGAYVPAGLGAEWDGDDLAVFSGGTPMNWRSEIGLVNFSPAMSYQVMENLSIGLAVNIYYAMFDMERGVQAGPSTFVQYTESSTGLGYGVTAGALFKVNEMISLGASARTKTDVTMEGEAENPAFAAYNAAKSDFERKVSWPLWFGAGIGVKPLENLTLALDVQYSQWSESEDEFKTIYKDDIWDANIPDDDKKMILHWEDATQIRVGAEYAVTPMATVRAGFYTDPAPAPDETYNFLFPSIDYNGFTGGFSLNMDKLRLDVGAEYLLGKERDITPGADNVPGIHNMNIFAFSLGVNYMFGECPK